ncbi:MAG: hypothetical protein H0W68_14040, partial [Gemmatimonadaceae bacterium]|nr:hypothetical protein [Gemmatimonadaceae bacterium]
MSVLIEVAFKGNRREFFLWEPEDPPALGAGVIVDVDRGEDIGLVHTVAGRAEQRSARVPHGLFGAEATRVARRIAMPDELRKLADARAEDDDARRRATERVKANGLVMKITDAEWQWDRKKLTFYFTAEKRVDFRTLVRELASMFRTRIELKQIGVRDEARRLDGVGRCGRQYCSASWLPELRPVNLGVAKDQRLSLNPSQISGACGRLMCCLRYEHEFYVASRRKYPKETKIVRTSRGEEKVLANDIFRERVTLRGVDGETRTIGLALLRTEMTDAGDPTAALLEAASLSPIAARPAGDAHHDAGGEGEDDDRPLTSPDDTAMNAYVTIRHAVPDVHPQRNRSLRAPRSDAGAPRLPAEPPAARSVA